MTPENVILHIISREQWQQVQTVGTYQAETLATEGFMHCSTPRRVIRVANKFYRARTGMILLCIEPDKVHADVRYETPRSGATVQGQDAGTVAEGAQERFPHIYGPLNIDAVINVIDFEPGTDGLFRLPSQLTT